MKLTKLEWWERFKKFYTEFPELGLAIDLSRMNVDDAFFAAMEPKIQKAFADMDALEGGAIANPDENRMVGHYWLRNATLAPTRDICLEIENTILKIKEFCAKVHTGKISGAGGTFKNFLLIGIGGSALGPQFVANALGNPRTDKLRPFYFDNTDPDGMERVLLTIGQEQLNRTLCIVISKSGGTKETRNGMMVAEDAYNKTGLDFGKHAIAITSLGSVLDRYAVTNKWLEHFPMWDWIGGRTSEFSVVGLLPAALQGIDIDEFLAGGRIADISTRKKTVTANPAALLALTWFASGNGKGTKNMVLLPYKDRLDLLSKYCQQLVMESLGKELDLNGHLVNQGLCVFGNKGSTDQHSYIQQLREGLNDFFAVFVEVLEDQFGEPVFTEPEVTSGDFLEGFLLGTRSALAENERESITVTIKEINSKTVGVLIAIFERAVGYYAFLVNINAYNQPGVEAGKKAAETVIEIQRLVISLFKSNLNQSYSAVEIAKSIGRENETETVFKICKHLAANSYRKVIELGSNTETEVRFKMV